MLWVCTCVFGEAKMWCIYSFVSAALDKYQFFFLWISTSFLCHLIGFILVVWADVLSDALWIIQTAIFLSECLARCIRRVFPRIIYAFARPLCEMFANATTSFHFKTFLHEHLCIWQMLSSKATYSGFKVFHIIMYFLGIKPMTLMSPVPFELQERWQRQTNRCKSQITPFFQFVFNSFEMQD